MPKLNRPFRIADRASRIIVAIPWLWIVLAAVGTAAWAYFVYSIQYEFSIEAMFVADSPLRARLEKFEALFGDDDNVLVIAHGASDHFSPQGYRRIQNISKKLQAMPGFDRVLSPTLAKTVRATTDGFSLEPFLEVTDPDRVDWTARKADMLADPLATGALVSKDGYAIAYSMELAAAFNNNEDRDRIINELRQLVQSYDGQGEFHLSGVPLLRTAFVSYMRRDQKIFVPLCTLVVNLLAFWLFRELKANLFSMAVIFTVMIWTLGALSLAGGTLNIITVVMPSLIMVMGMAYVTHFLTRYIEETANGLPRRQAVHQTVRHMILPIFLTSFTTGVGFASLLILKIDLVRQFGLFSAVGLGFAFLITMTLLSGLCLLFKPFNPHRGAFAQGDAFGRYLAWNDRFVKRRPGPVIAVSIALLVVSIVFITRVKVDSKLMEESNPSSPEYAAHEFMVQHLAGIVPLEIVLTADRRDAFKQPDNLRALESLESYARSMEGVDYAFSFADVLRRMNRAMHDDDRAYERIPDTRQAVAQYLLLYEGDDLHRIVNGRFDNARIALRLKDVGSRRIAEMEQKILARAEQLFDPSVRATVTGSSIMVGKLMDGLIINMVKSLFLAALVITILMTVLFKSIRLGLLAMIPNLVPILMTMGALGLLGITLRTSIVVVFSIALGIAVDDTIHFITRCRDEYKATGDYDRALQRTFAGTGRPIVFTSLLLFLGFGVLATSSFIPTRNFGMLSAITMVSALLGDLFLLPALLWVFKPRLN